jgi:1,2-diacylglycerol 3-alpha-glucosyltransferase
LKNLFKGRVNKVKIAVFTDCFSPVINGVVSATNNLVKGLAAKGHQVLLVTPYYGAETLYKRANVWHYTCRGIPAFFHTDFLTTSPIYLSIFKAIQNFDPEIIHLQTPWTIGVQAVLISKILRKPLVGTFHTFFSDPDYLKNIRLNNRFAAGAADKLAIRFYNYCNTVSAPSTSTLSELAKLGFKAPLVYISNGLDDSVFDNIKATQVRKIIADDQTILFLYVGRIAPEKNIFFLLDSFREALKTNCRCKLLIVGDGSDLLRVRNYVSKENLANSIIITGKIPYDELVASGIFRAADVFITASKTENQPMTVLEAQYNGLPVLGLNARGMPDLITDNKNGLLAPSGDLQAFTANINRVSNEKGLLERLKAGCFEMIKEHRLENVIDNWEKTYAEAVDIHKNRKVC